MTTIVWFRRDFRLADNPALHAAVARGGAVLPVFIHAPSEEAPWRPGAASDWWLHHSLAALAENLATRGAPLLILRGDSLPTLRGLVAATGATAVHWNRLYEPAIAARDAAVAEGLAADGTEARGFNAALLFEPLELKTAGGGTPFRQFKPFSRAATAKLGALPPPLPAPAGLLGAEWPKDDPTLVPVTLDGLGLLPTLDWADAFGERWQPGEAGARARIARFSSAALGDYSAGRNRPSEAGTSGLSPHLHFGEIGPRQVLAAVRGGVGREGEDAHGGDGGSAGDLGAVTGDVEREKFTTELLWREFTAHLLHHFPHTADAPFLPRFADFGTRAEHAADLAAWQRGRTGIPIVDAGMRELWVTGWMHNRVRMITGSFLVKNLLVPWQTGAQWFWDALVDADLAQNAYSWQWLAGSGADAAPWFRVFNPVLQGEKFDPAGTYVRRWLPELAGLPDRWLHKPADAPAAVRRAAGLADDSRYARPPIADLKASRDRALAAYRKVWGREGGGEALEGLGAE